MYSFSNKRDRTQLAVGVSKPYTYILGGEYVNIGDNIRVVYAGGSGKNGRLMIDAPREMNISRSNNDPNPEKRKDTYYPEPKISEEAQHEIKKIIWNERQKKAKSEPDKKA